MKPLKIRDVILDDGSFEPVLTITPSNMEELRQDLQSMMGIPFSLMEWRADYFRVNQKILFDSIKQALEIIREFFPKKVVIFTYRSPGEGGQSKISDQDLVEMREIAIKSGAIDVIDMELYWFTNDEEDLKLKYYELLNQCKNHHVKIILSYHEFRNTTLPDFGVIFEKMVSFGADIAKIAVKINLEDELVKLKLASQGPAKGLIIPHILIGMGEMGKPSRYDKQGFASCMTYTSLKGEVAPGQLTYEELINKIKYRENL